MINFIVFFQLVERKISFWERFSVELIIEWNMKFIALNRFQLCAKEYLTNQWERETVLLFLIVLIQEQTHVGSSIKGKLALMISV